MANDLALEQCLSYCFYTIVVEVVEKESKLQNRQTGTDVLNFQITMAFVLFAFVLVLIIVPSALVISSRLDRESGILGNIFTLTVFPFLPIIILGLFIAYQAVLNTVGALSEKSIRYALNIPFVK